MLLVHQRIDGIQFQSTSLLTEGRTKESVYVRMQGKMFQSTSLLTEGRTKAPALCAPSTVFQSTSLLTEGRTAAEKVREFYTQSPVSRRMRRKVREPLLQKPMFQLSRHNPGLQAQILAAFVARTSPGLTGNYRFAHATVDSMPALPGFWEVESEIGGDPFCFKSRECVRCDTSDPPIANQIAHRINLCYSEYEMYPVSFLRCRPRSVS
jgi:hypothetical protein